MPLSFKSYVKARPTYITEGITHIEDMKIDDFIDAVENMNRMIATQKLDGFNLWVGVDEDGKFYTSREGKTKNKRFYSVDDFENNAAADGFKAAHMALEKNKDAILKTLNPGEIVEMEILFGKQPNAVIYGSGGYNYIAFLRGINETPQERVDQLYKALHTKETEIQSSVHDSPDGRTITREVQPQTWKFVKPEQIDTKELKSVDVKKELAALKSWLQQPNEQAEMLSNGKMKTNYDVLTVRGSKETKEIKAQIEQEMRDSFQLKIKDALLSKFVRNVKPKLQDEKEDSFGIEGVVFLDPKTQKQFKLVDKDIFTAINKFNFDVRNKVNSQIKTDDPLAPLESRGGLFGTTRVRILQMLGIQGTTTTSGVKRALRKFKGNTPVETVKNIIKSLDQVNFGAVRKKSEAIIDNALEELDHVLDNFKKNADKYKLQLKTGKEIKYTPEVKRRTLLTFAETRRDLEELKERIGGSRGIAEIVIALFGKQIKEIHEEPADEAE
jgi:hypothetical protein